MSKSHFSPYRTFIGILLTLTLILILTLSVNAQEPIGDITVLQNNTPEAEGGESWLPEPSQEIEIPENNPSSQKSPRDEDIESMPDELERASTYYHFISASTFVPRESGMTYDYLGGGCVNRTGGGDYYTNHTLQLPEGAEIDYMRIFFYDNDLDHNAAVYLYAFDGYSHYTEIASASSYGTPGRYYATSGYFSHIVHNKDESLSLVLGYGNTTNSDLQICGVRIRFQYTGIYGTFLPYINN